MMPAEASLLKASFLLLLAMVAGCDNRPKQWDAFIYPDFEKSAAYEKIAGFKTFEQCQSAAINRVQQLPEPAKASYECGYKCRYDPQWDTNICKETRD